MKYILGAAFLLMPLFASANVVITEIMYDLPGTDSGREWVEITNSGEGTMDLSGWRFFEGDTNHKLSEYNGGGLILLAQQSAVIADDAEAFLLDWPEYSELLIDSSWSSLKNDGEYISIKNSDLEEVNTVSYMPEWGGQGDGTSVQFDGSKWTAGNPTPGDTAIGGSVVEEGEESKKNDIVEKGEGPAFTKKPVIHILNTHKEVISGAPVKYEAELYGAQNEALSGGRVLWNFGNGEVAEGSSVLHHYMYPGEYLVVVTASQTEYSKYAVSKQFRVSVVPAEVVISHASHRYIEIKNESAKEIDASWWILRSGQSLFTLPEHTRLLGGASVRFPFEVTHLGVSNKFDVALLYPNHVQAAAYSEEYLEGEGGDILLTPRVIAPELPIEPNENRKEVSVVSEEAMSVGEAPLEAAARRSTKGDAFPWQYMALVLVVLLPVAFLISMGRRQEEDTDEND